MDLARSVQVLVFLLGMYLEKLLATKNERFPLVLLQRE